VDLNNDGLILSYKRSNNARGGKLIEGVTKYKEIEGSVSYKSRFKRPFKLKKNYLSLQ